MSFCYFFHFQSYPFFAGLLSSGTCGHKKQFEELANKVKEQIPTAQVVGREGRRGIKNIFYTLLQAIHY
jgi:hypothetical protein